MPRIAFRLLATCTMSLLITAAAAQAQPFQVDPVHSAVLFKVKHMNTSYAFGRFNDISGTVDLDGPQPSIAVEVKTESVDTANQQRDDHLRGPDFFNAKQFPTISFKSTKITKSDDTHYNVSGELTLHGVSKPIEVVVERTGQGLNLMGKKILGVSSEFRIQRADYGMKHLVGPVANDVDLHVSLECVVQ